MRVAGWEAILHAAIAEAATIPPEWGVHDCATFAFDVRARITGIDDAARWRGKYRTARGCAGVMRRMGWASVDEGADALLGPRLESPLLAQRGDIVMVRHCDPEAFRAFGGALGVCDGRSGVFLTDGVGLRHVRLADIDAAWRV